LGIALEVTDVRRVQSYFAQAADINVIHPGTSQTFRGSIPAREVHAQSTQIIARLNRGPDGPRCAYDARRNNDGLGISVSTMRAWLAAGNASYSRRAPWAR
jgi:RNase P/RNase MRP subunit p30